MFAHTARSTVLLVLLFSGAAGPASAQVQVGREFPFAAESLHPYTDANGTRSVWAARVEHPGATYIALHFARFELTAGDRIVVRSEDGDERHVLSHTGRHGLETFWAPHIKGDVAVVELFASGSGPRGWGVALDAYAAGFADMNAESTGNAEAVCGEDERRNIACYADTEPEALERSRAVARLLIDGRFICTGWLVGCEGHLITANHCFDNPRLPFPPAEAVLNTDYEFLAEAPTCDATNGRLLWPGTLWEGRPTLVKRSFVLDYAAVHLEGNPQELYGSFLLEDRRGVADERIYIPQHPGGQAKKLALESTDATDESGFCEVTEADSGLACIPGSPFGETTYSCDTHGGSSGAPLVAYRSHQVIGLHHCSQSSNGLPACPNFAVPALALVHDLGADLPACAVAFAPDLTLKAYSFDDRAGNGNGRAEPFEVIDLVIRLENVGTSLASGIQGTLSTTTRGVEILSADTSWPEIPAGFSRANAEPRARIRLGPGVRKLRIDFVLEIHTDQGSFTIPFATDHRGVAR